MNATLQTFLILTAIAWSWWMVVHLDNKGWGAVGREIVDFAKRRAALVICIGILLLAVDWLILGDLTRGYDFWEELHADHWIALTAVAITLIGVYHWITLPLRQNNISD